jgi:hypothetical protein
MMSSFAIKRTAHQKSFTAKLDSNKKTDSSRKTAIRRESG